MLKEFKEFAMKGNVVDMAVGVIIGGAFGKIIASLVSDVLMPPLGALIGRVDFSDLALKLPSLDPSKPVTINYGLFINNVVNFIIIAFSMFLVIKGLSRLKRKQPPAEAREKNCPECHMSIPVAARKCGHCTSVLEGRHSVNSGGL